MAPGSSPSSAQPAQTERAKFQMPQFKGLREADVKEAMIKFGLKVGRVRRVPASGPVALIRGPYRV